MLPSRSAFLLRLAPRALSMWLLGAAVISAPAQNTPVQIHQKVSDSFRFVAYGDTRFMDPSNTKAANPEIRRALVAEIARVHPAFIAMTGDIVYMGDNKDDWKVFADETTPWRDAHIPVYPVIGNHEVKGNAEAGLANYFEAFPELDHNRFYSIVSGNVFIIALDSNTEELNGREGAWLQTTLTKIPKRADFVLFLMHHPPNTRAKESKEKGGGDVVRPQELALAQMLEERQKSAKQRFVVISGHVHNYDRHERNGVVYIVSGGGGAHPDPIVHPPDDPFQSDGVNYHYLRVDTTPQALHITMHRVELQAGVPVWTEPDQFTVNAITNTMPSRATRHSENHSSASAAR